MASSARCLTSRPLRPLASATNKLVPRPRATPRSALSPPSQLLARLVPAAQTVPFHASARKSILPPLPQKVEGTVNDPAPIPDVAPTHGSYHWTFERLISFGLIPLTAAPFIGGSLSPITDAVLCGMLLVHTHIGFQSVIIDYIPEKRLPRIRKLFWWGLRLATVSVGIGLYEFETNDVGVTETIKKMWKA